MPNIFSSLSFAQKIGAASGAIALDIGGLLWLKQLESAYPDRATTWTVLTFAGFAIFLALVVLTLIILQHETEKRFYKKFGAFLNDNDLDYRLNPGMDDLKEVVELCGGTRFEPNSTLPRKKGERAAANLLAGTLHGFDFLGFKLQEVFEEGGDHPIFAEYFISLLKGGQLVHVRHLFEAEDSAHQNILAQAMDALANDFQKTPFFKKNAYFFNKRHTRAFFVRDDVLLIARSAPKSSIIAMDFDVEYLEKILEMLDAELSQA